MTTTTAAYETLREALETLMSSDDWNDTYVGLRVIDSTEHETGRVNVGDVLPNSYVWDDGEWTEDRLDGVSAIEVKDADDLGRAIKAATSYGGDQLILVVGDYRYRGQDVGEIIIKDGKAYAVEDR